MKGLFASSTYYVVISFYFAQFCCQGFLPLFSSLQLFFLINLFLAASSLSYSTQGCSRSSLQLVGSLVKAHKL